MFLLLLSQRVLSTYMVESRVSVLGVTIMIWGSMPHNSTYDPLGLESRISCVPGTRCSRLPLGSCLVDSGGAFQGSRFEG